METAKLKSADPFRPTETQLASSSDGKKYTYTFSTQPLETDLKKLLTQVTGKLDLTSINEVKLKVVSGHAGLHRLSEYTPNLRILTLDGSCISSLRDLGSSLKGLTTLSVARCSMKHLDGVSGFSNLTDLNAKENFVSDPSPCSGIRKLSKLDLSSNQVTDLPYFAFLRSCRKLRELRITDNHLSDYREEMKILLPQLRILDGEEFEDCLQPEVPSEERFVLNSEDLSSEDEESSASFSFEDIDIKETQPIGDGMDTEDEAENFSWGISESDLNSTRNSSKILQEDEEDGEGEEEKEEEEEREEVGDPEETFVDFHSALDNLEVSNNNDKSTAHETPSGKLSSGRVICGNLAISLRARNPMKSLSLAGPTVKDDAMYKEDEKNEENLKDKVNKLEEVKKCFEENGKGDYCPV